MSTKLTTKLLWPVQDMSIAGHGVQTLYSYDVSGNVISSTRSVGGTNYGITASAFDLLGRTTSATNELGNVTTWLYSTNTSGQRIVTTVNPDNSTRVETYYLDGRLHSVTGTAVAPVCYDYGVDATGEFTVEYRGASTTATEWVQTHSDMLGRAIRTTYPDGAYQTRSYNTNGQLIAVSSLSTTPAPLSLVAYNAKGEAYRQAVDMDADGVMDLAGPDRVTETETSYSTGYRETITSVYPTNGSSSAVVVSTQRSDVEGTNSWSVSFGRTNHAVVASDRATHSRTETATRPDGTKTLSYYTNNLLMTVVEKDSTGAVVVARTFSYDSINRLASASEPSAGGDTLTTTRLYNLADMVTNVTISGGGLSQTTAYVLDTMGRVTQTILPDGGVVYTAYDSRGGVTNQWGARAYPVSYSYTEQGKLATMTTYRDWPAGGGDVTTWGYDSQRGWLFSKTYADGSSNSFQYGANGQPSKKTSARGIETSYSYAPDGALTNIAYSDSTHDVSYSRDRLGRIIEVTDATGVRTNLYAEDGALLSETMPHISGWSLDYYTDSIGRMTNVTVNSGIASVFRNFYSYDVGGRLSSVSDGVRTAMYNFGADGVTVTNIAFGGPLEIRKAYDGLGRLSMIANIPSNGATFSCQYACNQANQRTTNTLANDDEWRYSYDSLGQVTGGKKYFADGLPVQGAQYEYGFDTIGNRTNDKSGTTASPSVGYTANSLNQYTGREVAGEILATGEAVTGSTVTVRLNTNIAVMANRHDEYFWKTLNVTNAAALFATTNLQVRAYKAVGTNSLVRTEIRSAIVPKTPETFIHDTDGNLISDGLWTNTWDAENRLVSMESKGDVPATMRKRLEFAYDSIGRRTRKTVKSGYVSGSYTTTNMISFVWRGWTLIGEIRDSATTNWFVYGLDLSETQDGAAGIGGLLWMSLGGTNHYPGYDGNGNVSLLVDAAGAVSAEYSYGAFGELLKANGSAAAANPIRYSTKYWDKETGLGYWGARYYCVRIGRWLGRDPILESGGFNLYSFVNNAPVNLVDPDGLRIYFTKSDVVTKSGKKTGTIVIYNLLRYEAGKCCKEIWGDKNVDAKLKETAKAHAKILEDYINKANYTYDDGSVVWAIHLKMIITTEEAYSIDAFRARTKNLSYSSDEYYKEEAKYKVHGPVGVGAFSRVTVLCKPRHSYNLSMVPGVDPEWKYSSYSEILAHELIGHHLNNTDEIKKDAEDLNKRLGRPIEADAIMTYNRHARTFYNRNFAAGIDDIGNISGKKDIIYDRTSLLNISDPWYSQDGLDEKSARFSLEMIKEIIGIK